MQPLNQFGRGVGIRSEVDTKVLFHNEDNVLKEKIINKTFSFYDIDLFLLTLPKYLRIAQPKTFKLL